MRPTPAELIEGVRETLRPLGRELGSAQARRDFRRAMYILREGRWNDAVFDLLNENEKIAEALRLIRDWLNDQAAPGMFGHIAEEIELLLEDKTLPRNFTAANARNHALRAAMSRFLDEAGKSSLRDTAVLRREVVAILARRT